MKKADTWTRLFGSICPLDSYINPMRFLGFVEAVLRPLTAGYIGLVLTSSLQHNFPKLSFVFIRVFYKFRSGMPKAEKESLDFCWLNKTWSVEEHSAFQTLKINPSKLSNLKNTHQVHPTIFSVGFSAFWRVPHIVFSNIAQKKVGGELSKTTINI